MPDNYLLLTNGVDNLLLTTADDLLLASSDLSPFDYTNADLQPSLWRADLSTNLSTGSLVAADLAPSLWRADLQP